MNPRGLDGGFGASAASLTDLFETDALLDALGGRADSTDLSRDDALAQEPVLRLLSALADVVDDDLVLDTDPVVIAALAAGFELAASVEAGPDSTRTPGLGPLRPLGRPVRPVRLASARHAAGGGRWRRAPAATAAGRTGWSPSWPASP